jgi:hypothetical protein
MTKLYGLQRNQKWVVSGPTKSVNISMPCQFWSMGGTVFEVNAPIYVCLCSAGIPLQKYHLTLKLRAWPSATCNWPEMYRLEALERVVEIPIPMSLEMVAGHPIGIGHSSGEWLTPAIPAISLLAFDPCDPMCVDSDFGMVKKWQPTDLI